MTPEAIAPRGELWPPTPEATTVLLANAPTAVDRKILDQWVADTRSALDGDVEIRIASEAREAVSLALPGDAAIAPVRIAWLPPGRDGDRRWRVGDLHRLHRRIGISNAERQRILAREPDRCRVVVGDPARLSELRARARTESSGDTDQALARFVERQARLALDRRERSVTGSRYKIASGVKQDMVDSRRFEDGIALLAERLGRPAAEIRAEALTYLEEMACTQSALARELWARWSRLLYSRAYELCYDVGAIEHLRELGREHPLVFLPTHKANLDHFVFSWLLYEQGFPPNHTLGGINMAFWPLGTVGRRVGTIFIRRSIRDNPVYRWVLRQYLAYLIGKRFNLEWYIEGGRSRTGKLLPPKMGLLRYLVDAIQEAGIDARIVPVSIVYDQLEEVAEMTSESRGAVKQAEGLRWLVGYARRQNRASGRVQVHFGEPIAALEALERHDTATDSRLALSKLAFEICTKINAATPLTPTGVVTLAMLGVDDRSLTATEVCRVLEPVRRYADARRLPGAEEVSELRTPADIEPTLATLVDHGVVSCYDKGREPVYAIGPENALVAAFYRNTVIHWFVNRSIAELALVHIAERETGVDAGELAWREALRMRDLLKFEFFFADQPRFREEMLEELALIEPAFFTASELTLPEIGRSLAASGALMGPRVLRSFLEAYHLVAECLLERRVDLPADEAAVLADSLALGEQFRLQGRIRGGEAVSTSLFRSALKLADNRGLLEAGGAELAERRLRFAAELRDLVRRVRVLSQLDRMPTEDSRAPATAGVGGA
jgi:glycerol-3-phosphate O-acyltransferase